MTITSANYATPVMVNGYRCKNCTDVDYAKKHVDPAHPKSGPYGINAKDDPSVGPSATADSALKAQSPSLSAADATVSARTPLSAPSGLGLQVDVSV